MSSAKWRRFCLGLNVLQCSYRIEIWQAPHRFKICKILQDVYRKTSGINRTKSQNLNVSCIVLRLSSLNPLKQGVKLRMKM